jgi:hypothetical protein
LSWFGSNEDVIQLAKLVPQQKALFQVNHQVIGFCLFIFELIDVRKMSRTRSTLPR